MQVKRLTFASLLILVAIIGGCSTNNTVTGPGTNLDEVNQSLTRAQQPVTAQDYIFLSREGANDKNLSSGLPTGENEPVDHSKEVTFTGIVSQVDYPKGCIFIKTIGSGVFELKFRPTVEIPDLSNGDVKVAVGGWIDQKKYGHCVDGYVLEVGEIKVLDNGNNANLDGTSGLSANPSAIRDQPHPIIKLQGQYGMTKDGCSYLKNEKGAVELSFGSGVLPHIKEGALIEVTGAYSTLTGSFCKFGTRFNVESFKLL